MRILYVYADHPGEGQVSNWLCAFPAMALDRAGHTVNMMHASRFNEIAPVDADIIVVERLLWNGSDSVEFNKMPRGPSRDTVSYWAGMHIHDAIRRCQDAGAKVIGVFDDHYEAYPPHQIANKWLKGIFGGEYVGFVPIESFKTGLGVVNAVMTPSRFLCSYYEKYARRMYFVHNRPELSLIGVMNSEHHDGKVVIGWSGTEQHYNSWVNSDALRVLAAFKDYVCVSGSMSEQIEKLITSRGVECRVRSFVPYEEFYLVVASYDIGICPLGGPYDLGRSWIKWLECSLQGKPVVADANGVYDECVGGLAVSNIDQWGTAIESLVASEDLYREMSHAGRAWAWQQGWDSNLRELTDVFEEVLSSDD